MLSVHRTIREIPADRWDALACDNAFATHGWLLTAENSCRARLEPLYFALTIDGRLSAGAVCYAAHSGQDFENLDDIVYGRLSPHARRAGLSFLPALVCGPFGGYGWHIGVNSSLEGDDAASARARVLNFMEYEAGSRGLDLSFVHVLDDEVELKALLAARGYLRCGNVPVAVLDLRWPTFEAYMRSLKQRDRGEFGRHMRRYRSSGSAISCVIAPGDSARMLELLDHNSMRHNSHPFALGESFFEEVRRNLGINARVRVSRKDGLLTAAGLTLVSGLCGYLPAVGVDHETTGNDFTYFQIGYYTPIESAIESGLRRLYFGRGMYALKLRRGCRLIGNSSYTRPRGILRRLPIAAWFALASQWNYRKLEGASRRALNSGVAMVESPRDPAV